jgi:hypothetical protein
MKKVIFLIISSLFLINTFAQSTYSANDWKKDLEFVNIKVTELHPKLKLCNVLKSWQSRVDSINGIITQLNENEIKVEFSKLLTILNDGHTRFFGDKLTKKWFPIRIDKFADGFYVTSVDTMYADLYGKKVVEIGQYKSEITFELIREISCSDNIFSHSYFAPLFITMNSMLHGLGIINNENKLNLKIEELNGQTKDVEINAIDYDSDPVYSWYWLHNQAPTKHYISIYNSLNTLPLYLSDHLSPFWFKYISGERAVYLNVNQCVKEFEIFNDSLWKFIDNNQVDKLIIDLRNNFGGTNSYLMPFVHQLIKHENINKKENLFVLISSKTFSAALHFALWIENHCNPTFVGMPTAAGPNHFAEPELLELPNSKILIWISTYLWQITVPWDERIWIEPDIKMDIQASDYFTGRDPVLEKILK